MAVITFPNVPAVDGPLKLPRPAVYLATSADQAGRWIVQAARELGRHVPSVFLPAPAETSEHHRLLVDWSLLWMRQADIVGFWIAGERWQQFELGLCLGRGDRVIIGMPPDAFAQIAVVSAILSGLNVGTAQIVVGDTQWVAALEAAAKEGRRGN